ncbi:tripartite tricarboxylate transporter substrate binding protein [Pararoseomonas sp. SCSIO 73927]|uniref:Bug family tripartite tricarboxylate transporter substrate binding protein n=1 Tax=Pararoseomonas sp. SCSIO 73927 TaxID=3114537 RepID=UPI0030D1A7A5
MLAAPALLLPSAIVPSSVRAQGQLQWPTRSLQMIVGFPAGGSTDIFARLVAEPLGQRLGRPVVVENRAGAGGGIGAAATARAAPDGYTMQMATVGTGAINYALYKDLPFGPDDLASVSRVAEVANVIMVPARSRFHTLKDLVEEARRRPGELTFGHSGVGSSLHLTGELLAVEAGVRLTHVPFRGAAQMLPELIAGRIEIGIDNVPSSLQQIRDGRVRAIAVTSLERHPGLPDTQTTVEAGFPTVQAMAWWGVQVPRKVPAPVLARLASELQSITRDAGYREKAEEQGATPVTDTPEQFEAFVAAEIAKWRDVAQRANITLG